jgi:hypothetical protein
MIKLLEAELIITSGVLLSNVSVGQNLNIATHVPKSEILAALSGITNLPDQQARVIDIGNGQISQLEYYSAEQWKRLKMSQ